MGCRCPCPTPRAAQYDIAGLFGAVPLNATKYKGLEEGITGVQLNVFNQALQVQSPRYGGTGVQRHTASVCVWVEVHPRVGIVCFLCCAGQSVCPSFRHRCDCMQAAWQVGTPWLLLAFVHVGDVRDATTRGYQPVSGCLQCKWQLPFHVNACNAKAIWHPLVPPPEDAAHPPRHWAQTSRAS